MKNFTSIQYELKRNNRFLVEFPEQFEIVKWSIQKINKPKFTDDKWENIKIEFIDPIGPSTSQSLFMIVEFIKNYKGDDKILFEIKIKSLDPTGLEIEEWIIYVEKIITINFGELDYANNDVQTPFIIIKPLKCILKY